MLPLAFMIYKATFQIKPLKYGFLTIAALEFVKISFHPPSMDSLRICTENRADLVYEKEYNLNTKPLEIDLLVIKKDKDVQTANEIGWIFRGYNILEYKSPDDSLDIDAFYKAGAYASLYKAYGGVSDERKADDITVTLIREARTDFLNISKDIISA